MDPVLGGISAATGLSSLINNAVTAHSQKQEQAVQSAWSPWTGIKPQQAQGFNPMQGVGMGLGTYQGLNSMMNSNALNDALTQKLNLGSAAAPYAATKAALFDPNLVSNGVSMPAWGSMATQQY